MRIRPFEFDNKSKGQGCKFSEILGSEKSMNSNASPLSYKKDKQNAWRKNQIYY